jgi:hypothetical protein
MAPDSFHDSSVEAMFLRNDAGLALSDLFFAKAFFNEDGIMTHRITRRICSLDPPNNRCSSL